jgi:hypothetical protein
VLWCREGVDRVAADSSDAVHSACENVRRDNRGLVAFIRRAPRAQADGRSFIRLRLRCGSVNYRSCAGTVTITAAARKSTRAAVRAVSVAKGKVKMLRLRVPAGRPSRVKVVAVLHDGARRYGYISHSYKVTSR